MHLAWLVKVGYCGRVFSCNGSCLVDWRTSSFLGRESSVWWCSTGSSGGNCWDSGRVAGRPWTGAITSRYVRIAWSTHGQPAHQRYRAWRAGRQRQQPANGKRKSGSTYFHKSNQNIGPSRAKIPHSSCGRGVTEYYKKILTRYTGTVFSRLWPFKYPAGSQWGLQTIEGKLPHFARCCDHATLWTVLVQTHNARFWKAHTIESG